MQCLLSWAVPTTDGLTQPAVERAIADHVLARTAHV